MDNKEEYILSIIKEAYPELDAGAGTPFYELVVRPMAYLWTRHEEGNEELTDSVYASNYLGMSKSDLDRLMSNFFVTRKIGDYVYASVRFVFSELKDYYINKGMVLYKGSYNYYTTTDTYVSKLELQGNATDGYYVDVNVVSESVSNVYNLYVNDALSTDDALKSYIRKIYVIEDGSDGGVTETNADFYRRVSKSMSLNNLTTYRGIKAILYDRFNVTEVLPVGLRDSEMRRDLTDLGGTLGVIHRGGMADIYVKTEPYSIVDGYKTPIGFPYTYSGWSIVDSPASLLSYWNALNFPTVDIYKRGSMLEEIVGLTPATNMKTLTSNIAPIHAFCASTDYEAIHSDNRVKQMWPLVVRVGVSVSSEDSENAESLTKAAVVDYISSLTIGEYPKVATMIKYIITAGVGTVNLPVTMECYYLTENLTMQMIGLNLVRVPDTSILKPVEADSLKFTVDDETQISIRNCIFYCNEDLVSVEVV